MTEKSWKKVQKTIEKEGKFKNLTWNFKFAQGNEKVSFDCASASGLMFRALVSCLFAVTFACPFFHYLFMVFGSLWEASEAFEIEVCRRFGTKKLIGESFQKDTKTKHQKSKKM